MKNLTLIAVLLVGAFVSAQDRYAQGMEKAFQLWGENKPMDATNLFERIANAEPDNWLPYYYVAQVNTIISFGERDKDKLIQQLEKAQEFLDIAKSISPDNPELMIQQAMTHTAWIAYDGANYGMTLSPKVEALYAKAKAIDPMNPRVVLSKAEWDMGSARYFGKDTTPYCKDVELALELFTNFKPDGPFYPEWGKDRAEAIRQNCN